MSFPLILILTAVYVLGVIVAVFVITSDSPGFIAFLGYMWIITPIVIFVGRMFYKLAQVT